MSYNVYFFIEIEMSYSKDLRDKVLSHIDLGATLEEASKHFSVGLASIKRWRRNKRETGSVMGPGRPTGPYKICEDQLKRYIDENPDAFLDEIASNFNVTPPAILFALRRLKITRKKSLHSTKKGVKKGEKYI